MDRETHGNIATAKTLLSTGIIRVIYAIIAGHPLTLLGITGPVAILLGTLYKLSLQFDSILEQALPEAIRNKLPENVTLVSKYSRGSATRENLFQIVKGHWMMMCCASLIDQATDR
jgi:hypothetical protein